MSFQTTGNTFYNAQTFATTFANVIISGSNVSYLRVDDVVFQGVVAGYTSGGNSQDVIDKFPFATNANATDVGNLSVGRGFLAGQSSPVSGYNSGGQSPTPTSNTIDKFPFATDTNASDVGDLTTIKYRLTGQSSSTSGYTSGGQAPAIPSTASNIIDKFPFASDANASDVGDLTVGRYMPVGQSSTVSGYTSGGRAPSLINYNTIDKFPFATNTNASDVGDLTVIRAQSAGQSSTVSGYTSGGIYTAPTPTLYNTIDKFPFATDANATDVGDLAQHVHHTAGQSSTVDGYTTGGSFNPGPPPANITITRFPFATDAGSTGIGNLSVGRYACAGQQN